MYYVNHNACATLADAEEIMLLYRIAGLPAEILTETEYFEQIEQELPVNNILINNVCPGLII